MDTDKEMNLLKQAAENGEDAFITDNPDILAYKLEIEILHKIEVRRRQ